MYAVDDADTVVEISDLPQCEVGAPHPTVFATENEVFLVYYVQDPPNVWDGTTVAVVQLDSCYAHMFGPPNDEAYDGHPLAERGLSPYAAFEVKNSSWVRSLERMNSVHPDHESTRYAKYRHFIFLFHDSTFEWVSTSYSYSVQTGSIEQALEKARSRIYLS